MNRQEILKLFLLKLIWLTLLPFNFVFSLFFPPPEFVVLTFTRGWIPISKLKKGEAFHGMCAPYPPLK